MFDIIIDTIGEDVANAANAVKDIVVDTITDIFD